MSVVKLIIADENQKYAEGLSCYLHNEYGQAFEITCFTQKNKLFEFLKTGESAEILLADHKMVRELPVSTRIKSIVILHESPGEDYSGISIYKYQKADQIANQLLQTVDGLVFGPGRIAGEAKSAEVIAVYSPMGGSGKSTISFQLAYQYILQSKKVLLISLESYESWNIHGKKTIQKGFAYLLYLIRSKIKNLELKLEQIKQIDEKTGIHYLEREPNILEYKDIKIDDMQLFFSFVRKSSHYDAVILDLDSALSEIALGALKFSDAAVIVIADDLRLNRKLQDFERQLTSIGELLDANIKEKLVLVRNKTFEEETPSDSKTNGDVYIPWINNIAALNDCCSPDMKHFKGLYDAVGQKLRKAGVVRDGR